MRLFAILCVVAAALLLGTSRCSLSVGPAGPTDEQLEKAFEEIDAAISANQKLRAVVESVLLPGMNKNSCEWGSSNNESDPKSWYGCWDYVRGELSPVAKAVESRLRSRGFEVTRNRTRFTVELTAVRNATTVCVDALAPGFVDGRNTSPDEINPDPGDIFVDVWTAEPRDGSVGGCDELPAWQGE